MSAYTITIERKAVRAETIQKIVESIRSQDKKMVVTVEKLVTPNSRADRLSKIMDDVDSCKGDIESLRDELQDWKDNLPENLQNGDKGSELDEAVSELDSIIDSLDVAIDSAGGVNFPGMY